MNENLINKNQTQFDQIISKLRKSRINCDIDSYLTNLSELIQNQILILATCNFEEIEFEFFFDLIYNYDPIISPSRDEVLIFKSAIKWLSNPVYSNQREKLVNEIMVLVKFDDMNEDELKQCFQFLDTYQISNSLKDFLHNVQVEQIANHKINFESLFVDCFKI